MKVVFILFSVFVFWLKPAFSFIIFVLFLPEYFNFLNILINMYRNYNDYYIQNVEYNDVYDLNIFELWFIICRLQAFQRIYIIFLRKKIKIYNILLAFLIIVFGVPYRFLKLCYYFLITNKDSFRKGLEIYYFDLYYKLKEKKIEVFNRKIYINCFTIGKLIKELNKNVKLSKEDAVKILNDLKLASKNFADYESKNKQFIEMKLGAAYDKNNELMYNFHYLHAEENSTIHATSKIPLKLLETQKYDVAMPSLIKEGAKNPGSIITEKVGRVLYSDKCMVIPKYQLQSIQFNYLELFKLPDEEYKYMYNKNIIYHEILHKFHINNKQLLNELRINNYTLILNVINNDYMIQEIDDFYNNRSGI